MKDLLGSAETPANAFCDSRMGVNATFVISPEGAAITEGDNACKNSSIVYGTAQASKVIPDVYVVRSDYYEANKDEIQRLAHAMFIAKEKADEVAKNTNSGEYKTWMKASATQLLGSADLTEDVKAMFKYDANHAGFAENVEFFTNERAGRNFERVTTEINDALIDMSLIEQRLPLAKANFDWNLFKTGLKHADSVKVSAFNSEVTKKIISEMQASDTLEDEQFMSEEVKFSAGQSTFVFNPAYHGKVFDKLIDEATTYDSTLIIIQAHSDPSFYLINKFKKKAPESTLKRIRQKAWNLSEERAKEVRRAIIDYARDVRQIDIDESQFETVGYGIEKPKTGICGGEPCKINKKGEAAKKAYADNRRAVIGFTRIEAEVELSNDDFDF
jgi:outer membrane protein OmpA-like peptidoglycan-associated protein